MVAQIKANVTSWRIISIGNIYDTCLNLNKEGNLYGINTDNTKVDPHMMKNTEWGCVAYLSKSQYGKQNEEVYINNSSSYITGNAGGKASALNAAGITNAYNTVNGQKASTSGNIYGVYDMSGGIGEYTAAYVDSNNENLTTYGENIVKGAGKYKEVYTVGTSDQSENNYAKALGTYGDAVYETSTTGTSTNSWYDDWSIAPYSRFPFFVRGGYYSNSTYAGVFAFAQADGGTFACGFRIVLPII